MKKSILLVIISLLTYNIFSQTLDLEKQYLDSLIHKGKLSQEQLADLGNKWANFVKNYKYPELPLNQATGEIDFTDVLTFTNLDNKTIFQRCLQWIAISYGNVTYSNQESGKIIANGTLNLKHDAEYRASFGSKGTRTVQTSTSYTMILTLNKNKIKYQIINIEYTFGNYSETVDQVTLPIHSLFPIVAHDQMHWKLFMTALTESYNSFYIKLKKSLSDYVNAFEADNNF
jgi:hypothetical protein